MQKNNITNMIFFTRFSPLLTMLIAFGVAAFPVTGLLIPQGTAYFIPLISVLGVIILLLPRRSERWRSIGLSVLIGLAFALTLRDIISHALPTRWLAWGVIPVNDAKDFWDNALEFLARGEFYTPRGRVFTPLFYSGLIDLFDFNIRTVMWTCTMMAAVMTLCAVPNIRSVLGYAASVIVAFILIDFIHEHIGGLSSEIPGYVFGLGGFIGILVAVRSGSITSFLLGFLLLSMAMAIRIGAVFILPAVLIWAWMWLPPLWGRRWLIPGIGTIIFVMVFWLNGVVTRATAPESGSAFVNAVDSWYAVIVEGEIALGHRRVADVVAPTLWVQIYKDHPEIMKAPTAERPKIKMKIFSEALKRSPGAAAMGAWLELKYYTIHKGIFDFVDVHPIKFLIFILAILGGMVAFYETFFNRQSLPTLITFANLAIMVSQPFLFGGEHRAPVPIIGFISLLPAYGMVVIKKWMMARRTKVSPETDPAPDPFINFTALGVCIIGLLVCGYGFAMGGRYGDTKTISEQAICQTGSNSLRFHYAANSGLYIGPIGNSRLWPAPSLTPIKLYAAYEWLQQIQGRYGRWIFTPFDINEPKHRTAFLAVRSSPEGVLLFNTIDLGNRRPLLAVVSAPPLDRHGPFNACIGATEPNLIYIQPSTADR